MRERVTRSDPYVASSSRKNVACQRFHASLATFLAQGQYSGRRPVAELLQRLRSAPTGLAAGREQEAKGELVKALARVLETLVGQLAKLTSRIEHEVAQLTDGRIVMSVPRAGKVNAAQILSEHSRPFLRQLRPPTAAARARRLVELLNRYEQLSNDTLSRESLESLVEVASLAAEFGLSIDACEARSRLRAFLDMGPFGTLAGLVNLIATGDIDSPADVAAVMAPVDKSIEIEERAGVHRAASVDARYKPAVRCTQGAAFLWSAAAHRACLRMSRSCASPARAIRYRGPAPRLRIGAADRSDPGPAAYTSS